MLTPLQRRSHFSFMLCHCDYNDDNTNKNIRLHRHTHFSFFSIKKQSTLILSFTRSNTFNFRSVAIWINICRSTGGHPVVIPVWIIKLIIRDDILLTPVFVKLEKVDLNNEAEYLTRYIERNKKSNVLTSECWSTVSPSWLLENSSVTENKLKL